MRGHTRSWIAFCGFPFEKKKIPSLSVALTFAAGAQLSIAIVGGVGGEETRKEETGRHSDATSIPLVRTDRF